MNFAKNVVQLKLLGRVIAPWLRAWVDGPCVLGAIKALST